MKKFLGIVVLSLLIFNFSNAEIVLHKCTEKSDREFESEKYRKYYIEIDSKTKTIRETYYYTSKAFKEITDSMKEDGFDVSYLNPLV